MADQVRLGIIGIGNQGSGYAYRIVHENMAPELKLTAIADTDKAETIDTSRQVLDRGLFALVDIERVFRPVR